MIAINLHRISRCFPNGGQAVQALDSISLMVRQGEMIAITGPSGSGKSTLLNILGCLDTPDTGDYYLCGTDIARLDHNQLAHLRRQHLGFIFQRYWLLDELSVAANITLPTVYSGQDRQISLLKAAKMLESLGLEDRLKAFPSTLSGGQQQRVCIARALINDASIILADEPTGALDHQAARDVMTTLKYLNSQGRTVVIVTHDMDIARQTDRIIKMKEGRIEADCRIKTDADVPSQTPVSQFKTDRTHSFRHHISGALQMAAASLKARKLRTLLSMSGVVMGIAAVSMVVAIGNGAKKQTLANISHLGTNQITLYNERNDGSLLSQIRNGLTADDAFTLQEQPWTESVSPEISIFPQVSYAGRQITVTVKAVSTHWFTIRGYHLTAGRTFRNTNETEVVISQGFQTALQKINRRAGIGDTLLVGDVPMRIIGIAQNNIGQRERYPEMWMNWHTAVQRFTGSFKVDSILLRLKDSFSEQPVAEDISNLIKRRHGIQDFKLINEDSIRRSIKQASLTLTMFIMIIGLVALLTGLVGVMNIMLVSVSERTHEIGVRIAIGARRTDIMQQFILEAVLICLTGGILGIIFSAMTSPMLTIISNGKLHPFFSLQATVGAFVCALLTGVIAGYLPARKAARINPVYALTGR